MASTEPDPLELYLRHARGLAFKHEGDPGSLRTQLPDAGAAKALAEGYLLTVAMLAIEAAPADVLPLDAIERANLALLEWIRSGAPGDPYVELPAAILAALGRG